MASTIFSLCIAFLAPVFAHGIAKISDCGGPDKSIAFKEGSVKPDPVYYPGNLTLSLVLNVLKDLPPSDFEMQMNIIKLEPSRMDVPCLENIGSCTYDVCEMIENHRDTFCPLFPDPDECGCPMKAGSYSVKTPLVTLPDFGEVFAELISGGYEGNITLIDKVSNKQLGCCAMSFEIVPSS